MLRVIVFFLIAVFIMSPWYILAIGLSFWYTFKYDGYELIVLAILVDGFFGAFFKVPVLSLGALALVSFFVIIKPKLIVYT